MSLSYVEKVPTWENVGSEITTDRIDDILKEAGLNFTIKKSSIDFKLFENLSSDFSALVTDYGDGSRPKLLSFVKDNYEIIQPVEMLSFLDELSENVEVERAGVMKNKIWIIARVTEPINILGDDYFSYLLIEDVIGKGRGDSVRICNSMLRMICNNQFNAAFNSAKGVIKISAKEGFSVEENAKKADRIINSNKAYINAYTEQVTKLASMPVSNDYVENMIRELCNVKLGRQANAKQEDRMRLFFEAYHSNDNQNFKGTAMGVLNAYTDFATHLPNTSNGSNDEWSADRFESITMSNKSLNNLMFALENRSICPICGVDRSVHDEGSHEEL